LQAPKWLRRAAYGGVAAITALGGVSALAATAAHATSTFTFTRIGGADRYATAGLFDQASGSPASISFADGLPGHQSDALAASGYGGVNTLGMLLTDTTNTIPANTQSALTSNGVKTVTILGGTSAVSSAQQTALQSAGFTVTRIGGATRFDTMQMLDDSLTGKTGKDSSGNNVGILASGNDNHLVDALSAGGVAYGQKFPVILTDSTSSTLAPQASQVISALNIKHVIVVGGTASVPASQYASLPNGATATVEAGADRSETSKVFSDFAISQGWAGNTRMELARGDDGADALGSADYAGGNKLPTCVTNSSSDVGSCTAYATEHASTLAGPSVIAGGTAAVPDSQASAVATAGGGSFPQSSSTSVATTSASSTVQNGKTTTITATVTNNGTPVQGATVNFTTSGTGCGTVSPTSAVTNSGGQATTTYTAGSTAGSCTVTATESSTGKSSTTSVTTTTASTGATNLPQLVSAAVVGEFSAATANGVTSFPGTLVQYVFGQDVSGDTLNSAGFHAYTADGQWRFSAGAGCIGGTCAFHDPSNKNAVDVFFQNGTGVNNNAAGAPTTAVPDLTTSAGAATLTLATVGDANDVGGAAVTAPAPSGGNVVGSASMGSASTATLTAGTTSAPDPESIGTTTRLGSTALAATLAACGTGQCSAIDVTFDQAAFDWNADPDTTHFEIVYTNGVNGANGGPATQEKFCDAPGTGNTTASGGAVPGGNGTATLTIVCPNPSTVSAGTAVPTADIARIVVLADAVASATGVTACTANGGPSTGGAAASCNPLEVTDSPNASDGNPVLTSVTLQPNTPSGNSTAIFTFDQALSALTTANVYNQNGTTTPCAVAPTVNPSNSAQWACTFGTATALNAAVGGNVPSGNATSFSTTRKNSDTELGASNPTSSSVTPGKIAAPQLTSFHAGQVTTTFGTSPGAVYTFSEPVLAAAVNPADLVAWDSDGTELVCTAATAGSGTSANQVTCTAFSLLVGGGVATANQITTAVWGGNDWKAVQGTGVSGADTDWSPEGGAATT